MVIARVGDTEDGTHGDACDKGYRCGTGVAITVVCEFELCYILPTEILILCLVGRVVVVDERFGFGLGLLPFSPAPLSKPWYVIADKLVLCLNL